METALFRPSRVVIRRLWRRVGRHRTVEENRRPPRWVCPTLRVKIAFARRLAAAIRAENICPNHLDKLRAKRFGGPVSWRLPAGSIDLSFGAQLASLVVDVPSPQRSHVLLQIVDMLDPFGEMFEIDRVLWHEHNVRPAIGRTEAI